MEIARGLRRIGSDIVNSYLIVDGDDVTIIDAGLPGYWRLLEAELAAIGKTIDNIRALVLTHGDTDHIGFAARLYQEKGISAHIHTADVERARLKVKKPSTGWGPVKIKPFVGFLWYSARRGGFRIPPAEHLHTVEDGDVLDVPGTPRIIHTPGHTPGSVSVHVPMVDALFLGDAMTTRNVLTGVTGPKPAPFTLHPDEAITSLDRIEALDATWLLPGHGPAWNGGAPEAIRLIRQTAGQAKQ
jgi:glyoxylase-like metal-dependent hydrolase (beta-lactamase superfamily II)